MGRGGGGGGGGGNGGGMEVWRGGEGNGKWRGGDGGEWDRKGAREGEAREIEDMQRVKGVGGMKLHLLFHLLLAR